MNEGTPEQDTRDGSAVRKPTGYDFFAERPRRPKREDRRRIDRSRSLEQTEDEADTDPRTIDSAERRSDLERPHE